ncbi:MAG: hypothetical protein J0L52_06910 [Caulobacterales bacterium]|nr:hypothetical protein [Caulobacterales bacterium]
MTADDRLKQALGPDADAPPAVDHAFTARVLARVEQRRLWMRLGALALWAGAAALLGWALRPVFHELSLALAPASGVAALMLAAGAGIWLALRGDLARALRRARTSVLPGRF